MALHEGRAVLQDPRLLSFPSDPLWCEVRGDHEIFWFSRCSKLWTARPQKSPWTTHEGNKDSSDGAFIHSFIHSSSASKIIDETILITLPFLLRVRQRPGYWACVGISERPVREVAWADHYGSAYLILTCSIWLRSGNQSAESSPRPGAPRFLHVNMPSVESV